MKSGKLSQRILRLVFWIAILNTIGAVGYGLIEGWDFWDSLYMTVITLGAVGYREIGPLSIWGRVFTIFLIFLGIALFSVWIATVTSFMVEGDLKQTFRRRKMEKTIAKLEGHYILCGAGRTGWPVIEQFISQNVPLVVIERDGEVVRTLRQKYPQLPIIQGQATDDQMLLKANIQKARGLIAALSSDTDNLFVVISARALNREFKIVSRAFDEQAKIKMYKAGADHVICPNTIGGIQIATMMLNPSVSYLLEMISNRKEGVSCIEGVPVCQGSSWVGKELSEIGISNGTGLSVIAIKKGDGRFGLENTIYNPDPYTLVHPGDMLVIFGHPDAIRNLKDMVP